MATGAGFIYLATIVHHGDHDHTDRLPRPNFAADLIAVVARKAGAAPPVYKSAEVLTENA